MAHASHAALADSAASPSCPSISSAKIAIVGAGHLARSLLSAWQGCLSLNAQIYASTATQASLDSLLVDFPALEPSHLSTHNEHIVPHGQVVVLCVKPDKLKSVLVPSFVQAVRPDAVVVSLIAGIHEKQLRSYFLGLGAASPSSLTILRAIPNVASAVSAGLTSLYSSQPVRAELRRLMDQLFAPVGLVSWLAEERLVNPSIALGASGPAFVAMAAEGMVQGALASGLPRQVGLQMAAQVLVGVGKLLLQQAGAEARQPGSKESHKRTPASIIDTIATPGGCTIAGLLALERGGLRASMADAILSAVRQLEEKDAQTSSSSEKRT